MTEQTNPKTKTKRFATPADNAVRAQKQIAEYRRRIVAAERALSKKRQDLHEAECKTIESLSAEERDILFRLDPHLKPPDPVAFAAE